MMLAEEAWRMMVNMDHSHNVEERALVLQLFIQKLSESGYNGKAKREILTSSLKKYYQMVRDQIGGGLRIYRLEEDRKGKHEPKELQNQNWYRRRGTRE